MFGGRDDRNLASNRLLCIQVDSNAPLTGSLSSEPELTILKLEPKGLAPPGRYMHTMTYFQERSLVTISGGRNDKLSKIVLDDVWVLRLDDLEYCKVSVQGDLKMQPRYNHSAAQFGSKLILFGGMNDKMTLEMSVQEFELDNELVEKRVKNEEQEKAKLIS